MISEFDIEILLEEQRWEDEVSAASPLVREWCRRFLAGEKRSTRPTIDELTGWELAKMAPAHLCRTWPKGSSTDVRLA